MALRKLKPTSAGQRFTVRVVNDELHKGPPHEALVVPLPKTGGRNNQGRITTRHRGGGHKRLYRIIDFKRDKDGIPAKVAAIEYDPNRTANIALLHYADGEKRYILAPVGLRPGQTVMSGEQAEISPGNAMKLKDMPIGTVIHNVELIPGKGGQLARSAGTSAQLVAREGRYAHVQLPSGEVRLIHVDCKATIGQIGNVEHENVVIGKAGRKRHLGWRPAVRGSAMNPVDHPHGGGEGKAPIGRQPTTPWGKPAHGKKTRKTKHRSDQFIVRARKTKRRKR